MISFVSCISVYNITNSKQVYLIKSILRWTHSHLVTWILQSWFKKSPSSITKRFLPILPPHLHPHTGLLPDNWEDYQPDPDIPDVSKWDHHKIKEYFTSHGFSNDICQIFVEQVCNHISSDICYKCIEKNLWKLR